MIKNITSIVIFSLFISHSTSSIAIDTLKYKLYGKVKSIKVNSYETLKWSEKGNKCCYSDYDDLSFNAQGFLIEKVNYRRSDGKLSKVNNYFENGTIKSEKTYHIGCLSGKYVYSKSGKLIEVSHYSEGTLSFVSINTYDENDSLIEFTNYEPVGVINRKVTYEYNSDYSTHKKIETDSHGDKNITLYEYDEHNNLIFSSKFNSSNILVRKKIWKYDNNNNVIKIEVKGDFFGRKNKMIYFYDKRNNRIKSKYYEDGESISERSYIYDENNLVIETIATSQHYHTYIKRTFKYDSNDNVIEESKFNSSGVITEKVLNKYNNYGDVIEEVLYKDGVKVSSFKRDSTGNEIERVKYNSNGNVKDQTDWVYNHYGLLAEKILILGENIRTRVVYFYDKKGILIKVLVYDINNKLIRKSKTTYKHDKNGNWIKKVEFSNGVPVKIVERSIEYYYLD